MRFFFKSRQFKVLLSIFLVLIAVSLTCILIGGKISPQADIIGTISAPFRAGITKISNAVSNLFAAYTQSNEIMLENAELESELNQLREQLAEYETKKAENEFYKQYLDIKDQNPDFKFAPANLISKDNTDPYKSFVINKGSLNGISEKDPVITEAGLIGYISEVGLTTSKVSTLLAPDVKMGALDNRTIDSGVVSGDFLLIEQGLTKFYNLSRSCNVAVGDFVVTSGEGIFPKGLLIGSIQSVGSDEYNTSFYATVEPFVDFDNIKNVMVITDFSGQGGITVKGD